MKILRAEYLGMCFGVRDAIDLALEASATRPLTILGELVHNDAVLENLSRHGIRMADQVAAAGTQAVMVTAHGASQRAMAQARSRGHQVIEATCPLVQAAHRALARLVAEGYHPVIIGKRDHVEVRGMTGDLAEFDVVSTEADVFDLADHARFGVVAQTTQPVERVRYLVNLIRWRFAGAEVRLIDTVCLPTKQRQNSAVELAQQSDVVVVIGGEHSNNTRELVVTCRRHCERVYHVQSAGDLRPSWFAGTQTVGFTAGTSTPDEVIAEVHAWLKDLAAKSEPLEEPAGPRQEQHPLEKP